MGWAEDAGEKCAGTQRLGETQVPERLGDRVRGWSREQAAASAMPYRATAWPHDECLAVFSGWQLQWDRSSRSEGMTVAVGFSPRSNITSTLVAERRLNDAVALRCRSSVALRRVLLSTSYRGLKPTAPIMESLRDCTTARIYVCRRNRTSKTTKA